MNKISIFGIFRQNTAGQIWQMNCIKKNFSVKIQWDKFDKRMILQGIFPWNQHRENEKLKANIKSQNQEQLLASKL